MDMELTEQKYCFPLMRVGEGSVGIISGIPKITLLPCLSQHIYSIPHVEILNIIFQNKKVTFHTQNKSHNKTLLN